MVSPIRPVPSGNLSPQRVDVQTPAGSPAKNGAADKATELLSRNNKEIKRLSEEVDKLKIFCSILSQRLSKQTEAKRSFRRIREELSQVTILFHEKVPLAINKDDYEQAIAKVASCLMENDQFELIIQGHSNANGYWGGGVATDMQQSGERATAVRTSLLNSFKDPADKKKMEVRLKIEKKGFAMPVENSASNRNCRVTFSIQEVDTGDEEEKLPPLDFEDTRSLRSVKTNITLKTNVTSAGKSRIN